MLIYAPCIDWFILTLCSFAGHLKKFCDVFVFHQNNSHSHHAGDHVTLHPMLMTPDERTAAVADVVRCLGEEIIPGIRNEVHLVNAKVLISFFRYWVYV